MEDHPSHAPPPSPPYDKRGASKSPHHPPKRSKTDDDMDTVARRITLSTSKASRAGKVPHKLPTGQEELQYVTDIISSGSLGKDDLDAHLEGLYEFLQGPFQGEQMPTHEPLLDATPLLRHVIHQKKIWEKDCSTLSSILWDIVLLLEAHGNRELVHELLPSYLQGIRRHPDASISNHLSYVLVDYTYESDPHKMIVAETPGVLQKILDEAMDPDLPQASALGVLANLAGHDASRQTMIHHGKEQLESILHHFFQGVALQDHRSSGKDDIQGSLAWTRLLVLAGRMMGRLSMPEIPLDELYYNVIQVYGDDVTETASIFLERVLFDPLFVTPTTEEQYYQVTKLVFDLQLHSYRKSIYKDYARLTLVLPRLVEWIRATPLHIWHDASHYEDMVRQAAQRGLDAKDIKACSQYGHFFFTLAQIAAANPANRLALIDVSCPQAVIAFLKSSFQDKPDKHDGWFHRTQQRGALFLLAELCRHHDAYAFLHQAHAIPLLLRILDTTSHEIQDNHVALEVMSVLGRILGSSGLRRHSTIKTRLPGMVFRALRGMGQLFVKQGMSLQGNDRDDLMTIVSFNADLFSHFPDCHIEDREAWKTSLELFRDELKDDHFFGLLVSKTLDQLHR